MIHRAVAPLIVAFLLSLAASGIGGCGKSSTLSSIILLPQAPVVAKGAVRQILATALFSDGLLVTGWTRLTWASSDPTVAAVSTNGLVSGLSVGTAVITATDMSHPSVTASVTVSVTELQSITVAPAVASIPTGTTQQFTAIGTYTASTPSSWSTSTTWPDVDLTTQVLWTSSSTAVATIGSNGIATAVSAGTTTITATELVTRITGTPVSGTAALNVF